MQVKITQPKIEHRGDESYLVASFIYQDSPRPRQDIYYAVPRCYAGFLSCDVHAFLIPAAVMAMRFGETQISTDAPVCRRLLSGIRETLNILKFWHYPQRKSVPKICCPVQCQSPVDAKENCRQTAGFFSGGVDAFSLFKENHAEYPESEDPNRINLAIFVSGFEIGDWTMAKIAERRMRENAALIGVDFLPVRTNLYYHLREWDRQDDFRFWHYHFQGAAFAGVAHALANGIAHCYIAASVHLSSIDFQAATHPLIDTRLRTDSLEIHHEGIVMTRLQKVQSLAKWDTVLKGLRVCNRYQTYTDQAVNCGRCEKCLRTMLEFVACDARIPYDLFGRAPTVSEAELSAMYPKIASGAIYYDAWKELYRRMDAKKHPETKAQLSLLFDRRWVLKQKLKSQWRAQKRWLRSHCRQLGARWLSAAH